MSVKRYTLSNYRPGYVIEDPKGNYVRYSEHENEINHLKSEIQNLKEIISQSKPNKTA